MKKNSHTYDFSRPPRTRSSDCGEENVSDMVVDGWRPYRDWLRALRRAMADTEGRRDRPRT